MRHYLDYNATAPLHPQVAAVMQELQSYPLNASSVHSAGRKAKGLIEDARRVIANCVSAFPNEVIFMGSGTEANNAVLRSFTSMPLFASPIEHSSILGTLRALHCGALLAVTPQGTIDLKITEALLPAKGPFLLSVMLANNETGVIQPIAELANIVHARGGLLHCDAVQALGKIPVDFTMLGCDMMTVSGHKMGGPVGAAALIVKSGLEFIPQQTGGGQEMNRRAGTENVAAIAGFAKAVVLIDLVHMQTLRGWLGTMETELKDAGAVIIGEAAQRLPNTSLVSLPGVPSETQLIRCDLEGIMVSAGSACSSGRVEPSHVLKAMGIEENIAGSAIRVSAGWNSIESDINAIKAVMRV